LQQTPNNNMTPIKIKIDVTKIDKSALFKGAKGTYLDAVMWPTPDSQYGQDYRIVQDLGKEARDAGQKGAIIGNAKNMGTSNGGGQRAAAPAPVAAAAQEDDGNIPF
jgi:hypothetical protein